MKVSNYKDVEFLKTEECKDFQTEFINDVLGDTEAHRNLLCSKRVLFYVSWLPTSKQSSHLIYIFKIVRILSQAGYSCKLLITGFEFSHHRGINFYLSKSESELQVMFELLAFEVAGIEKGELSFDFLIDSSFTGELSHARLKLLSLNYLHDYRLNENSLVFMTSGNIACKAFDSFISSFKGKKVVVMTNVADNLERYRNNVDYVLSPSNASSMLEKLAQFGFESKQILNYTNVPEPFNWASAKNEESCKSLLDSVLTQPQAYSNILLLCSARMNRKSLCEYYDCLKSMRIESNTLVIFVGADSDLLDSVVSDASFRYYNIEWLDDIYTFFGELADRFRVTFFAIDSSGGNTIANAVLQGCAVVVPTESDAANFIVDDNKYINRESLILLVEKNLHDLEFRAATLVKQERYLAKLADKNLDLFTSL